MGQKPIGERCFELLALNQNDYYQIAGVVSTNPAKTFGGIQISHINIA